MTFVPVPAMLLAMTSLRHGRSWSTFGSRWRVSAEERFAINVLAAVALALPAAGFGGLQPPDLTPVTWLKAPDHPPVEIVRDGEPRAVIYVAEPDERVCQALAHLSVFGTDKPLWEYPLPPALPRGDAGTVRIVRRALRGLEPGVYMRSGDYCDPALLQKLLHELIEVVRLGTGATLQFVVEPPAPAQPAIVIGDCEESRAAGIVAEQIPLEGFVIKTAPNRVYLVGSTRAPDRIDGTAWAVTDFLERFVGVRWYWPANYGGRSVPRNGALVIPPAHYSDRPVFAGRVFRTAGSNGLGGFRPFGMTPLAHEGHNYGDQMPIPLPLVNRCGLYGDRWPAERCGNSLDYVGGIIQAQDAGTHLVIARAEGDPLRSEAVFALNEDGTRNPKWNCFSADETVAVYIAALEPYWDDKGRLTEGGHISATHRVVTESSFTVWFPASPGLACHCPACRKTASRRRDDRELRAALVKEHGERRAAELVEARAHELVYGLFLRRLCEAVKQRWPGKKVVFNANERKPPEGVTFPDNFRVGQVWPEEGFNTLGRAFHPSAGGAFEAAIRGWGSVGIWASAASPSDWTYGPVQYPHLVRDFYRRNRDVIHGSELPIYNMRILVTSAPTWYVWRRVLWNPELDVDATLDEMCRRLFGPGAKAARELLRIECDRWQKTPLSRPLTAENRHRVQLPGGGLVQEFRLPADQFREFWPMDVVGRMKELRNQALAAIDKAGDTDARQSLLYWTCTYDAFYEEAEAAHRQLPADFAREKEKAPLAAADHLPATLALELGAGTELKLTLIRPGEFLMGSRDDDWGCHPNEQPQHRVRITLPFYMGIHEVTEAQYEAVTGTNRTQLGRNRPVVSVSWHDATAFCEKLGAKTGRAVRLPTEAEWEFACRAGTTTAWFFGDLADLGATNAYAWYPPTEGSWRPEDVGGKKPNAWGLHDMHGNVHEWCSDRFAPDYYAWGPTDNPTGPETGIFRVLRGGSNINLATRNPELTRSARRSYAHPDIRLQMRYMDNAAPVIGFRIVIEAEGVRKSD